LRLENVDDMEARGCACEAGYTYQYGFLTESALKFVKSGVYVDLASKCVVNVLLSKEQKQILDLLTKVRGITPK
jgi:hypothetical protein